jgi:two-component system response regulator PhoP
MRVLVVEDDVTLNQELSSLLNEKGFAVDSADEGRDGLFLALEYPVDMAVIDLGLPGMDGVDLIREVRAKGRDFPILILTARDGWRSKVEGLEAGADDYLVKPFHSEELLARMRALLRRTGRWTRSLMVCGPVALDTAEQSVTCSGKPVTLTAYEYKVLEYLMLHAGDVISKSELTEHIYEEDSDRDSNVIEVFIRRLRTKLDPDGSLAPIDTLRGRGYRFTLPREDA